MTPAERDALAWEKGGGLIPAIVEDASGGGVLMLGYMDRAALDRTFETGRVTFWSRSRGRLWTKGESSGNRLEVVALAADCDGVSLLVTARPSGPVCHTGTASCFSGAGALPCGRGFRPDALSQPGIGAEAPPTGAAFLAQLDRIVERRERERPDHSYTSKLFADGLPRIAQKVGEEAVETVLAAVTGTEEDLLDESADLVFHLLVLLRVKGLGLADLSARLAQRHGGRP